MRRTDYDEAVAARAAALNKAEDVVRSFYRVRQALGYLGLSLPVMLIVTGYLGARSLEPSVSDFFHTLSRDLFVGTMCAIAVFLITYDGYDRQPDESFSDNWISTIAGIAALGVAFFPNESPTGQIATLSQHTLGIGISPLIHYSSPLVFFYCMGHFCLFKFSRTGNSARRRIYRTCGWVVALAGLGVGIASLARNAGPPGLAAAVSDYRVIFWIEALGVWAFSIAWLVKGRGDMAILSALRRR